MPGRSDLLLINNALAHLRATAVGGFTTQSGNGSAQITGLSAAVDMPIAVISGLASAGNAGNISIGSVSFSGDRVQISDTNTTNDNLLVVWFDKDPD